MAWSFVIVNSAGVPKAEVLNATERNVSLSMGRPSTASFTIRPDNPVLSRVFNGNDQFGGYDEPGLQVWADFPQEGSRKLMFSGPIISSELANQDDGSGMSIKCNAADAAWRLTKRLAGKAIKGTTYTELDKGETAKHIIEAAGSGTGIDFALLEWKSESKGTYVAGPYKPVLSCINDLANGFDGFDWRIVPWDDKSTIGQWKSAPVFGTLRGNTVFEYGWGKKNIRKLTYLKDMANVANRVFHLPDDLEAVGAEVITKENKTSQNQSRVYETVADASGIVDKTLRENWAQENVDVRSYPRRVLAMTLDTDDGDEQPQHGGRVPTMGSDFYEGDFWLGDQVRARGVFQGTTLFNGIVRIYQINVSLNDAGRATITPILVDDAGEL